MRPHFRAFVNRTDFADLTIECANGSCVAHKVLILGRTPHLYRKWCPGALPCIHRRQMAYTVPQTLKCKHDTMAL